MFTTVPSTSSSSSTASTSIPTSPNHHAHALKAMAEVQGNSKTRTRPTLMSKAANPAHSHSHCKGKSKKNDNHKNKNSPLRQCMSIRAEYDKHQSPISDQEGTLSTNLYSNPKGNSKEYIDSTSTSTLKETKKQTEIEEGLNKLINSIDAVYRGYSSIPSSAYGVGGYIISLSNFYKRAKELLDSTHRETLDNESKVVEEIEKLEREWYDSDIVASWYGPRPRPIQRQRQCHSNSQNRNLPYINTNTLLSHQTPTHPQLSYSRTPFPPKCPRSPSTNANANAKVTDDTRTPLTSALANMSISKDRNSDTVTNNYDVPIPTTRVDLFKLQRRDASYVGLNDE